MLQGLIDAVTGTFRAAKLTGAFLRTEYAAICGAGAILLKTRFGTRGHPIRRSEILEFLRQTLTDPSRSDRDRGNAAVLARTLLYVYPDVHWIVVARELECSHTGVVLMSTLLSGIFALFPRARAVVDIGTGKIKVSPQPVIPGTVSPDAFELDSAEFNALLATDPVCAMEWLSRALAARDIDLGKAVTVGTAAVRAAVCRTTSPLGSSEPTSPARDDGRTSGAFDRTDDSLLASGAVGGSSQVNGRAPDRTDDPLLASVEASAVNVGPYTVFVITGDQEALILDRVTRSTIAEVAPGLGRCAGTCAHGGGSAQGTLGDGTTWTFDYGVKAATVAMKGVPPSGDGNDDDIVATAAAVVEALSWTSLAGGAPE
jgi:hypothetical protein